MRAIGAARIAAAALALAVPHARAERDPDPGRELDQIVELLAVAPGSSVADVGAGGGEWTRRLARQVGPDGRVFATEVTRHQVDGLRAMALHDGLSQVTVVAGDQDATGLPDGCCEAMLLRLVYHAFDRPAAMRRSLQQALRPGARVLIIDFRPPIDDLVAQMEEIGFEAQTTIEAWRGQEDVYAVLFLDSRP